MNVILVSDSPVLTSACRETLQSVLQVRVAAEITCRSDLSAESIEREIDAVTAALSDLPPRALRRCIGIAVTQLDTWPNLNPLQAPAGLAALVGELILAFPELHWLLVGPVSASLQSEIPEPNRTCVANLLASVSKLAANEHGSVPALFDPSGLRNLVKQRALRWSVPEGEEPFADRQECAAAIDDEGAYAYFHALAAYRFGHRVAVISSAASMRDCLGPDKARAMANIGHKWSVIFEDLYLNFADRSEVFKEEIDAAKKVKDVFHLSDLAKRDRICPGLAQSRARVIVTAGHARGRKGGELWQSNIDHLQNGNAQFSLVFKPTSGLFRLWHDAGLTHRRRVQPGVAGAFRWPPGGDAAEDGQPGSDHSAPGRLLKLAERLLARGRAILSNADGVEDAVHAAVLAIDAKELLANRTPTTSLEAISLQHEAEVTAESLFVGVEYNLDLRVRLRDVTREVDAIVGWFNKRRRELSSLNARLAITEKLAQQLGDLNQVEEEAACLAVATRLRFDFWMEERRGRRVLWPLLRYLSLVSSLPRLAVAVFIWILLFGTVHFFFPNPHKLPMGPVRLLDALSAAAYSFTALQPVGAWQETFLHLGFQLVLVVQSFIAWLNLGLLVSHLYALISRR